MKKYRDIGKILLIDTVIIACILLVLLITKKSLILYNDQIFQYDIFYETWANMLYRFITTGELPFYSFNTYLGSDFYSSMLYYCTGNIFFPLLIIFRNNIRIYIVIEYVLCIYISSITMYLFLYNENISNRNVLLFAVLTYSFSGFAMINTGNYMFLRFYAFFPLSLFGISLFIKEKNTFVFVISVAILFAQNYYLMWPGSILMFLFFFYKVIDKKETPKKTCLLLLEFVSLFVLGMMLIAFLLLPGLYYIINNSRIGVNNSSDFIFNIRTTLLFIYDFIAPNISSMSTTALQSINPDNYHIYSSSLTIGLIPLITAICYIKNNIKKTIVFVVLFLGYIFTSVSSMLHGFSVPSFRWIFILIPIILLFSSKQIENNRNLDTSKTFVVYILLDIISFIVIFCMNYSQELYLDLIVHIVFIVFNVILYFMFLQNFNLSLILNLILYIISFAFIIVNSCFSIPDNIRTFDSYTIDMLNDTSDDLMFRIYAPYQIYHYNSVLQLNESMREKFMSTSSYSSVNDPAIKIFHNFLGIEDKIVELSDSGVLSMLGTKYCILPKNTVQNRNDIQLFGYMNGEYPIYLINDYKGFSRTFEHIAHFGNFTSTNDFNTTLFVEDGYDCSTYTSLHYDVLDITEKGNSHLKGIIDLENRNILLIPIPNNKGWKIIDNGNIIKPINVNGGFIGLPLESGKHDIEMYFKPYLLKEGLIISSLSLICYILFLNRKRINNLFQHIRNNH